jgi:uncharacterized protein YecE (DUF72 family)
MTRPSALRETLQLSASTDINIISVPASGDCFFDCIHELLLLSASSSNNSATNVKTPCRRQEEDHVESTISNNYVPTSQQLRDYVVSKFSNEQLDSYKIYATAGLTEYNFATNMVSLNELKQFASKSGKVFNCGPGKCYWADEFALRTISDWLQLTILIIDNEASRGNSGKVGGGKRKLDDDTPSLKVDNRFVYIGNYERAVILHRSRSQHYNAVVIDNHPVFNNIDELPSHCKMLWALVGKSEETTLEIVKPCDELFVDDMTKHKHSKEDITCKLEDECCDLQLSSQLPTMNDTSTTNGTTTINTVSSNPVLGNFYCGCAGFSSASWVGNFYPKAIVGHNTDRQLDYYQQHFRTVEINSTFYGIPSESTVKKWKNAFATNFKVVMKAPRGMTHVHSTLDINVLSTFLSRMEVLGSAIACILIQCPRTLRVTTSQLEELHLMMKRKAAWYHGGIAFEFRNKNTFYDDEVREFIRLHKYAIVMHPNSLGRSTVGTSVSGRGNTDLIEYLPEDLSSITSSSGGGIHSTFVYVRLHGFNDEHSGEYSMIQLQGIAQQIHTWREQGLDIYCFFLNDQDPSCSSLVDDDDDNTPSPKKKTLMLQQQPWKNNWAAMPKNTKQLEHIVYQLSNEDIPDPPKKSQSKLFNFWNKAH